MRCWGFEKSSDWHVTSSPPIALSASSTASQGSFSLAVPAKGYVTVQSATLSLDAALPPTISFDLSLPTPVNPSWAGAAQLYVDCHSHSLFNQYLGQQELTGQPTGQFVTESYSVPASIQSALARGCADLSFTIAINVPTNQTGNYLLDNLQLGGSPTVVSCQSTIGQADAGAATVAFSNQVTRPDLGTFVLNTTIAVGDPQIMTRNVSLNGKPLYDVTTQAPSSGASTTTLTLFPPILGVHQISTTSDGTTFTVVADGRRSVPMPVQNNLSGLKFQDGQPPPQVTIPPGVSNAIAQLMVSAGTQLPTCLAAQTSSSSSEAMQLALASSAKPTSGRECAGCFWKCYGLDVLCAAAAPLIITCSVLTSFLGPLGELLCTEVVDVTACVSAMHSCERDCTAAGSSCCPVDCGGANQTIPTTGTCCRKWRLLRKTRHLLHRGHLLHFRPARVRWRMLREQRKMPAGRCGQLESGVLRSIPGRASGYLLLFLRCVQVRCGLPWRRQRRLRLRRLLQASMKRPGRSRNQQHLAL